MIKKETVRTKDGSNLAITAFIPEQSNNYVIVLGPAATMGTEGYHPFAGYLADQHFIVVIFEFRGTGLASKEALAGYSANMSQWATQDLDGALLFARNRFPGKELILIAHGVSGEISGLAPASTYIKRLILINSALTCWRMRPFHIQLYIWLLKLISPFLFLWYGYFPGRRLRYLSNLPEGVMREWASWCNNPNGLFDEMPDNNYRRLQIPLLAISFRDNPFIPEKAVKALLNRFANARVRWLHLWPDKYSGKKSDFNIFFQGESATNLWPLIPEWIENEKCCGTSGERLAQQLKEIL